MLAVLILTGCEGALEKGDSEDGVEGEPRDNQPDGARDGGSAEARDAAQGVDQDLDGGDDLPGSDSGSVTVDDGGTESDSGQDSSVTPTQDASVNPPKLGSAGCGSAPLSGGMKTIEVNGKSREFFVSLPKTYDKNTPYPLLFGFHGASRSATDWTNDTGTFKFGPAMGDRTILVYPNALNGPGPNPVSTWSRDTDDDLAFFDAMLAKLLAETCLDAKRVYATGHSSGGYWANTLGCRRGDVLRAVAPVAGGVRDFKNCKGEVAVWMAHGIMDNQVPVANGEAARKLWVAANGCAEKPAPAAVAPSPCVAHAGCRDGYPVHWCAHTESAYGNTGHGWPSFATAGVTAFVEGLR